jgi:hypothetical protein
MKRRQRARLGSMGRKCDTTQPRDDIGQRRGGSGEGIEKKGDATSWADVNLAGAKNKENLHGRFS